MDLDNLFLDSLENKESFTQILNLLKSSSFDLQKVIDGTELLIESSFNDNEGIFQLISLSLASSEKIKNYLEERAKENFSKKNFIVEKLTFENFPKIKDFLKAFKILEILESEKELFVYHKNLSFGKLESYTQDEICVQHSSKKKNTLDIFLKEYFVFSGKLIKEILDKKYPIKEKSKEEFTKDLLAIIFPKIEISKGFLMKLLINTGYFKTTKTFDRWYDESEKKIKTWNSARTVVEFFSIIKDEDCTSIEVNDTNKDIFQKILLNCPDTNENKKVLLEILIILLEKGNNIEQYIPEDLILWSQFATFIALLEKLKVTELTKILQFTAKKKKVEALYKHLEFFDLRSLRILQGYFLDAKDLSVNFLNSVEEIRDKNNLSSDLIVFLWENLKENFKALEKILPSIVIVFRSIGKGKSQAEKALLTLVVDNEAFQKFLTRDGNPKSLENFILGIQKSNFLFDSQKQSVLIKITRNYEKAKTIIEMQNNKVEEIEMPIEKISSFRSIKRLQKELDDIINNQIPQNKKDINTAREFGDLKENAEYIAGKERQKILNSRKGDLEIALASISATDFLDVQVSDRVVAGCELELAIAKGKKTYTILGLFDGDADKGYISTETAISKVLLGKKLNDLVTLPNGNEATIIAIKGLSKNLLDYLKS